MQLKHKMSLKTATPAWWAGLKIYVRKRSALLICLILKGGGHTWPGGIQYLPKFVVGSVNHDFNASSAIVDFFSAH